MTKTSEYNSVDYSIIIPVYFNEGSLRETYRKIESTVFTQNAPLRGEVIFVDDGSGDGSLNELLSIRRENPKAVRVIKFTRNFGQNSARLAGYNHAKGKCFIHVTADLQDPPEIMNEMLKGYFEEGYEVVIAKRKNREESFYRRVTSFIFYWIINKLCFNNMPVGGFDYHLIGSKVRDIILSSNEANPFFQGQILWTGFEPKFLSYTRMKRKVGKSRWTFSKKVKLLIDGIMGYTFFPLRIISISGIIMAIIGLLTTVVLAFKRLYGDYTIEGWTSIIVVFLIVSGVQMLMLGMVGEYIWRILDQVRFRRPFVIEMVYDETTDETST